MPIDAEVRGQLARRFEVLLPHLNERQQRLVLLAEIRELGCTGSANLLVRYLNQGHAQAERASPPPLRPVDGS